MSREFKRILIAVKDMTSDERVVDAGLDLAIDEGAEVVFVHVVSIAGEVLVRTHEISRVPEHATDQTLIDACAKARALELEVASELLVGYPARQIALVAEQHDVDLIVVGSRRISALKRAMLGSTSRALITESTRPVFVVPLVAEESAPVATPA